MPCDASEAVEISACAGGPDHGTLSSGEQTASREEQTMGKHAQRRGLVFDDEFYEGQLERTLATAGSGLCDLGEAVSTARSIGHPTPDGWFEAWFARGEATCRVAESDLGARVPHGVAGPIASPVPTLVVECEGDPLGGAGPKLVRMLTAPSSLVTLTEAQGGSGHCGGLGQRVLEGAIFDWVEGRPSTPSRRGRRLDADPGEGTEPLRPPVEVEG
jgi:hypothetical protein